MFPLLFFRLLEKKLLTHSFMLLLHSMQSLFTQEEQIAWSAGVNRLSMEANPQQHLPHLLSLVVSKSQPLQPDVAALLGRCFEILVDIFRETQMEKFLPIIGHGFVYVGLLLSHFLCPCGPVDPLQKASIKLEHVLNEVRYYLGPTPEIWVKTNVKSLWIF